MIRKVSNTVLSIFACVVCLCSATSAFAEGRTPISIEGLQFEGQLTVVHTNTALPERVTFENGELISSSCQLFGFTDSSYSIEVRQGVLNFQAFGETAALGYVSWHGTIVGETLDAVVHSRDPGESEVRYTVSAKLVKTLY